jgi:formate dehydrogenase major subunit
LGLQHGNFATITTPRGVIEARVLVTNRMKPLSITGRSVHQIGVPFHFGTNGLATGDSANDLLPISEEPNVRIMEAKALMCDITPGRRPRGKAVLEFLAKKMETA